LSPSGHYLQDRIADSIESMTDPHTNHAMWRLQHQSSTLVFLPLSWLFLLKKEDPLVICMNPVWRGEEELGKFVGPDVQYRIQLLVLLDAAPDQ
jgi:hypothetical protein